MDLELIRGAFWEDATNSHGPVNGSVEDFIEAWHPAQEVRETSFHIVSNQQVDFDGDGRSAHAETYFVGVFRLRGEDGLEIVGGRYADRYVKRGSEWRIGTRVVLLDWQGVADASGMEKRLAKRHHGSRGPDDPTYERPIQPRDAIATPW